MDLAASGLLLGLDLVERELESAGGCQPGLQQRELNRLDELSKIILHHKAKLAESKTPELKQEPGLFSYPGLSHRRNQVK